jgi:hypothetical protein
MIGLIKILIGVSYRQIGINSGELIYFYFKKNTPISEFKIPKKRRV